MTKHADAIPQADDPALGRLSLAEAMILMAALAVRLAACRVVAIQVFDPNWHPPSK